MLRNDTEPETNRGQVGIGTLIVFIAMVLVAAIAAGVLINTAGFLQTQAEDTGTESTDQVANNLNVITEVGNVSDSDDINELRVGVQPAAGSDDVNLADLTLQYVSDDEFANIIVANDTQAEGGSDRAGGDSDPANLALADGDSIEDQAQYLIDPITAEDETDLVMTDNADRYEIVIPLAVEALDEDRDQLDADDDTGFNQGELEALEEGADVEITITTQVGAQTVSFMQVPDSLAGDDAGSTVNL